MTELVAAICLCLGATTVAYGQQQSSGPSNGPEEIVITGSRIARRDYNAPSPVLTVDSQAFEQSSNVSLEYVLNQYPQFNAGDTQFVATDIQPTADNSPGASTLDLRGLGPSRTLVLLDGRRAQPINAALAVDVNTLPAAAIGGVEVISGGAAATYGPDAMAGVVNFKLKRNFEGVSFNYQTGWTSAGDGQERRADGLIGGNFASGRGNAMVGLGYAARDIAYEINRNFYQSRFNDNGTGANYIRTDYPNYIPDPANLPTQTAVNSVLALSGQSRSSAFFVNPVTGTIFRTTNALATGYDGPTTAPYLIRQQTGNLEQNNLRGWLSSPMTRNLVFGRATFDVTDKISMFVQGTFNKSSVEQLLAPTPLPDGVLVPRNRDLEPTDLQSLLDSRQNADAPYKLARTLYWFPNRGATSDTEVSDMVFGLNGSIPNTDWTWEVYHQTGTTTLLTHMDNFIWNDRYAALAAQPGFGKGGTLTVTAANDPVSLTLTCTSGLPLLQPYVWNGQNIQYTNGFQLTPDCVDAVSVDLLQRNVVRQKVTEANFQGKIANMRGRELRGAFGVSNRLNYSLFEPDPLFLATTKAEGETEVSEIYGELLVPLTKKLEFEVGARYSDFSTGDDWELHAKSYKALFNWTASDSWRIRGGWQRANRVPNVAELYAGASSQVFGWGTTGDICMSITLSPWGNVPSNPNRAQVQELCRQLIYKSGGAPGANDYDTEGADNYPNDGRAIPGSYRLIAGGNPRLNAELADTWTAGMVWQSRKHSLTVSADWYNIDIDNVVDSLGFLTAYQQCFNANGTSNPTYSINNEYCQRITRDPVNAEPVFVYGGNFNLSRRRTSGVDLTLNWTKSVGKGDLNIVSSANRLLTWKQPVLSDPDAPLFEYAGYGDYFSYRLLTTVSYRAGRFGVSMNWRHTPEQKALALVQTPTTTTLPTDSYDLFNVNGTWAFTDRLRMRAGIDNVFDVQPSLTSRDPYNPRSPSNGSGITNTSEYDSLGRRYFVGVSVTF